MGPLRGLDDLPAHPDAEVLSVLARLHRGDVLTAAEITRLLDHLAYRSPEWSRRW